MSTTTLTKAAATRLTQSLSPGLPPLPFPIDWSLLSEDGLPEFLTEQQQEANLLHVALWIIERGIKTFDMSEWHIRRDLITYYNWHSLPTNLLPETFQEANHCNTTHCIAGFAQVMSGPAAFNFQPAIVGRLTLGQEAARYFLEDNETALGYLRDVIARNS